MRKRINHHIAVLVGSSDVKRVKDNYKALKEGHEERMEVINKMTFTVTNPTVKRHYGKPYIKMWGEKMYLRGNEIRKMVSMGIEIHYEEY